MRIFGPRGDATAWRQLGQPEGASGPAVLPGLRGLLGCQATSSGLSSARGRPQGERNAWSRLLSPEAGRSVWILDNDRRAGREGWRFTEAGSNFPILKAAVYPFQRCGAAEGVPAGTCSCIYCGPGGLGHASLQPVAQAGAQASGPVRPELLGSALPGVWSSTAQPRTDHISH